MLNTIKVILDTRPNTFFLRQVDNLQRQSFCANQMSKKYVEELESVAKIQRLINKNYQKKFTLLYF